MTCLLVCFLCDTRNLTCLSRKFRPFSRSLALKASTQVCQIIYAPRCCCSSGVEHFIGNEEVDSSNLSSSTIFLVEYCDLVRFWLNWQWVICLSSHAGTSSLPSGPANWTNAKSWFYAASLRKAKNVSAKGFVSGGLVKRFLVNTVLDYQ